MLQNSRLFHCANQAMRYSAADGPLNHVLVVHDDTEIRKLLGEYLGRNWTASVAMQPRPWSVLRFSYRRAGGRFEGAK
jgi:hypothetical protein